MKTKCLSCITFLQIKVSFSQLLTIQVPCITNYLIIVFKNKCTDLYILRRSSSAIFCQNFNSIFSLELRFLKNSYFFICPFKVKSVVATPSPLPPFLLFTIQCSCDRQTINPHLQGQNVFGEKISSALWKPPTWHQ